jgi:hypothetical protein
MITNQLDLACLDRDESSRNDDFWLLKVFLQSSSGKQSEVLHMLPSTFVLLMWRNWSGELLRALTPYPNLVLATTET